MIIPEENVYSIIGEEGFQHLVAEFYSRIPTDSILGPMYTAADLAGAEQRLRDFLIYRFGGPQTYIEQRGHPRLRMRHAPFQVDQAARDRWMQLMNSSLEQVALPEDATDTLRNFFENTATFLKNS